jgi:hypothetical protein
LNLRCDLARPLNALFPFTQDVQGNEMFIASLSEGPSEPNIMEAFLISTLAVSVGEIGDKTQLLALLLAARYRKPVPIILGILIATLLNHTLAGLIGHWVVAHISKDILGWVLGLSFFAIAAWTLKPDEMDDGGLREGRFGVFLLTTISFFFAEIGDKTQLATVALAAKYVELACPSSFPGESRFTKFPVSLRAMAGCNSFCCLGAHRTAPFQRKLKTVIQNEGTIYLNGN